eukprot:1142631-Pelagomonas_calceolata.AAC.2
MQVDEESIPAHPRTQGSTNQHQCINNASASEHQQHISISASTTHPQPNQFRVCEKMTVAVSFNAVLPQ